ncbi:hypothetical protein PENSPDRAFT_756281 [Peniophora sp. CONT]|nr:hypothetical protein PENSPDRAFT_756281 [Peniophora sp. CONT]
MLATHGRAFADDPMFGYIFSEDSHAGAARSMLLALCQRLFFIAITAYFIFNRVNYQIDGGAAYITWNPRFETTPPPDRVYTLIMGFLQRSKALLCTPEQKRRDAEYGIKLGQARTSVLGENPHEFICLNVLAADPAVHGRGYGRSLMELLCATADDQDCKVWLTSTNSKNTRFYEASGFVTMRDITLGEATPTWEGEPVTIKFMIREPRSHKEN